MWKYSRNERDKMDALYEENRNKKNSPILFDMNKNVRMFFFSYDLFLSENFSSGNTIRYEERP